MCTAIFLKSFKEQNCTTFNDDGKMTLQIVLNGKKSDGVILKLMLCYFEKDMILPIRITKANFVLRVIALGHNFFF